MANRRIIAAVLAASLSLSFTASAQDPKPVATCPTGSVTCETWCAHWHPTNLKSCKDTHPNSCLVKFGKEGGYNHCLQDTPNPR